MNRNRSLTVLAAIGVAVLPAGAAMAVDDGTDSGGYAEAGASAVQIDEIITVVGTSASTKGDGSADATVLAIGGSTIIGSHQDGEGEASDELLTTGENSNGFLTLGGSNASVTGERSAARAALLDGNLGGDGGISLTLIESRSEANRSSSNASTTAARVDAGDQVHLELLGAETASDAPGGAYLISINGERILTSDDAAQMCSVNADPVARLLCLYADAVEGDDPGDGSPVPTGNATGVTQYAILSDGVTGSTFTAQALSDPGTSSAPDSESGPTAPDATPRTARASDSLPVTGATGVMALLGLGAMGSAGALLRRRN